MGKVVGILNAVRSLQELKRRRMICDELKADQRLNPFRRAKESDEQLSPARHSPLFTRRRF
jgi:hypothetical protein